MFDQNMDMGVEEMRVLNLVRFSMQQPAHAAQQDLKTMMEIHMVLDQVAVGHQAQDTQLLQAAETVTTMMGQIAR